MDIPALNTAMGNIQKSLQRYVGFEDIDYDYCDKIESLMDKAQIWAMDVEEVYNKAEIHSINTSKGDSQDVGVFYNNSTLTIFEFLESAEFAYLGLGNSVQKANQLFNKHLSEEIKTHLIEISDDYYMMKNWLICNYGSPSRIVGDIVSSLIDKRKPGANNRKEKFVYYSAIIGALQRLEKLSRSIQVNRDELESCLLSRSTYTSLINLLPSAERDLWVREMNTAGLDFRNPEGSNTLACFKRVCMIERNTNENYRENSNTVSSSTTPNNKKAHSSNHLLSELDEEVPVQEPHVMTVKTPSPAARLSRTPTTKWKFPCPLVNHDHEVKKCREFFDMSPRERWEKLEKNKMCFYCLGSRKVYKTRKCVNFSKISNILKCTQCASWAAPKGLALFSFFLQD